MGKRKVSILTTAAVAVAEISFFIESKGLPDTAKNLLIMLLPFLKHWLMTGLNTESVLTKSGAL